jgi:nucleoid DNA-binding protein
MKHTLIIFATLLCCTLVFGQAAKEKAFQATLEQVVNALSQRDSVELSKYIDNKTGVYILNRIDEMDQFKHYPSLGFSDKTYPNTPFYDGVKLTPLQYAALPKYDCEKWSATGSFVDTTQTHHQLSDIARQINSHFHFEVPRQKIVEFRALEKMSRKVVIADNNENDLVLYLSYIGGKWVLTIIDKVSTDCSS